MAIEVGSGSRAERAPSSSSSGKTSNSSSGKSSSSKTSSSSSSSSKTSGSSKPAESKSTWSNIPSSTSSGGGSKLSGASKPSGAKTTWSNVPSVAGGGSSGKLTNTPKANSSSSSSSSQKTAAAQRQQERSTALYDALAMDPVRGGKQFFPEMDAAFDPARGAMRLMISPAADPFISIDAFERDREEDERVRDLSSRMTGIGAMPGYNELASMLTWRGPGPRPMTQSPDLALMRNPVMSPAAADAQATPVPRLQSADLALMRNPTMSSEAADSQVTPFPRPQSVDLALMRNPAMSSTAADRQVTPFPRPAGMRPEPLPPPPPAEIYRGPFVPSGRDLGMTPEFEDMLDTLGIEMVEPDDAPFPRPSRERPVDPRIVQTMLGEAANQGDLGLAAVAHSIMNRSERYGLDPVEAAIERRGTSPYHQYSAWNDVALQGNNPTRYQPGDPLYERAEELYRDVRDNAYDFTFGATHYYNPDLVSPNWADPDVEGTERLFDQVIIGDHAYLPRVAPGERGGIPSNPALVNSIASGGIGPDPRRAPVPFDRPAALGGIQRAAVEPLPQIFDYTPAGLPRDPDTGFLLAKDDPRYPAAIAAAPGFDPRTRLPADAPGTGAPVDAPLYVTNNGVPVIVEDPMGGGDGTTGRQPLPGSVFSGKTAPIPMDRPDDRDMSVWDNVASAAGKVFENTAFGGALKAIFPEFYDDMGDAIMGFDDRGPGRYSVNDPPAQTLVPGSGGGDRSDSRDNPSLQPPAPVVTTPPAVTPPGVPGPDGLVRDTNGLVAQLWWPQLRWPGEDYDPGVDPEWDYLPQFAEGGAVPGPSAPPAVSGLDPRFVVILNAEDALKGQHTDPDAALQEFIEIFGEAALGQLKARVDAELAQGGSRMIRGPGGPKDDAIPAVINDVQEARLSDGEFVVPAEAVAGAGEGDPELGAMRLTELSDRLGGQMSGGLRIDRVA